MVNQHPEIDYLKSYKQQGYKIILVWVPSHVVVEGKEEADALAKTLENVQIGLHFSLSKFKIKWLIKKQ